MHSHGSSTVPTRRSCVAFLHRFRHQCSVGGTSSGPPNRILSSATGLPRSSSFIMELGHWPSSLFLFCHELSHWFSSLIRFYHGARPLVFLAQALSVSFVYCIVELVYHFSHFICIIRSSPRYRPLALLGLFHSFFRFLRLFTTSWNSILLYSLTFALFCVFHPLAPFSRR